MNLVYVHAAHITDVYVSLCAFFGANWIVGNRWISNSMSLNWTQYSCNIKYIGLINQQRTTYNLCISTGPFFRILFLSLVHAFCLLVAETIGQFHSNWCDIFNSSRGKGNSEKLNKYRRYMEIDKLLWMNPINESLLRSPSLSSLLVVVYIFRWYPFYLFLNEIYTALAIESFTNMQTHRKKK